VFTVAKQQHAALILGKVRTIHFITVFVSSFIKYVVLHNVKLLCTYKDILIHLLHLYNFIFWFASIKLYIYEEFRCKSL